jgi:ketosteroid isomerase-like protein
MTTRETIQRYFDALKEKKGWESFLADDVAFTSYTSPVKQVNGKDAYVQATKRFYSTIVSVDVRGLIVEGDRACARTHYELQPPNAGPTFASDVAEFFSVANGKIESLAIYFDSAPFPK